MFIEDYETALLNTPEKIAAHQKGCEELADKPLEEKILHIFRRRSGLHPQSDIEVYLAQWWPDQTYEIKLDTAIRRLVKAGKIRKTVNQHGWYRSAVYQLVE